MADTSGPYSTIRGPLEDEDRLELADDAANSGDTRTCGLHQLRDWIKMHWSSSSVGSQPPASSTSPYSSSDLGSPPPDSSSSGSPSFDSSSSGFSPTSSGVSLSFVDVTIPNDGSDAFNADIGTGKWTIREFGGIDLSTSYYSGRSDLEIAMRSTYPLVSFSLTIWNSTTVRVFYDPVEASNAGLSMVGAYAEEQLGSTSSGSSGNPSIGGSSSSGGSGSMFP